MFFELQNPWSWRKRTCTVRCPHTFSPIQMIPFDWFKNRSHFITCVSVDTLGGSSAEHCVLPMATHEESRLGLFTDLASTVLATAAEEDAGRVWRGGGAQMSWSGRGVQGCGSGFCVFIDASQYLVEIKLFQCCGLCEKIRQQMVHIWHQWSRQ